MRTEVREEEKIIKDKHTIYIAEDGKEFDDIVVCKEYERRIKRNEVNKKLEKFIVRELEEQIPIHDDDCFSSCNAYRWFKVENEEEFNELNELLGEGRYELYVPETYPTYICAESENDFDIDGWTTDYSYTLDECMKVTKSYFEKFGYDVEFKKRD